MPNVDTPPERPFNVGVLVLGDVGRSPRMQYHALSFAEYPDVRSVFLIGYEGEDCFASVNDNNRIDVVRIPVCAKNMGKIQKAFLLFYHVWSTLSLHELGVVIVQNPPSIPTLIVCSLWCGIHNCTLIYDWHNLGFTMFSSSGIRDWIYSIITFGAELCFGQLSDLNFCVSNKMREWLSSRFCLRSLVLYDFPPEHFCQLSSSVNKDKIKREFIRNCLGVSSSISHIIMSSSSYTEDEDLRKLFNVLTRLDDDVDDNILILLTGKGPMRPYFESQVGHYRHLTIKFVYLSSSDYILALQLSDLGLCFHSSTSSLDLPMKVRDMFGCGLLAGILVNDVNQEVYQEMRGVWDDDEYELFRDDDELMNLILSVVHKQKRTRNGNKKAGKSWKSEWYRVCYYEIARARNHVMCKARVVLVLFVCFILMVVALFI